ncbi:13549_t:CDS:2 [Entrophospora sp. SA101]|nr:3974_t:CDS:2 [Entrophospora sp. SA101]CAJ0642410.1 13549_t:CDS:2 [Entrophospora sp. SA101]CAJ0838459.1 10787_t:CDS:2 [Entrophospora sp. SA101]CAJ0904428.1 6180_t:CDS:2 [Entrophospora sp. SA101]CAJ0910492.1 17142_t:CDS:2 [Entrophospora sp. SA101]
MEKGIFFKVLILNVILQISIASICKLFNYDNIDELWDLTIIHTNDVHSRYEQINDASTDCTKEQEMKLKCYGGIARQKTVIDNLRKQNKNSLLLDGGDQFQGNLFFTYYDGLVNSKAMNLLGYNVTGIGNHEFDRGPKILAEHHSRLNFPVVCSNVNATLNPNFAKNIKPYHIFEEYNLAVIGYITDTAGGISNSGSTLEFYNPIPIVQHYVDELRSKGIKRILTVSHNGYVPDKELAAKTHGVAVHIGGHSHTLLLNDTTSKDYAYAQGPYPTLIKNAKGEDTLVVQAYWSGKYMGHLDVSLDKEGRVKSYSGAPILLNQSIPQDPNLDKLVKEWKLPFENYTKTVIGRAESAFDQKACQLKECEMGNLLTDSMLWARKDVPFAFVNSGSIRSGLSKGNITIEYVKTILPFGNSLVEIDVTGQNITDMLESAASRLRNIISNKPVTSFIQVSGLKFKYDSSKKVYERILEVKIRNPNNNDNYEDLDLNKTYKALTLDFIANTGDGLLPYPTKTIELEAIDSTLQNYISKSKVIKPFIEDRIIDVAQKLQLVENQLSIHEPIHFGYTKYSPQEANQQ